MNLHLAFIGEVNICKLPQKSLTWYLDKVKIFLEIFSCNVSYRSLAPVIRVNIFCNNCNIHNDFRTTWYINRLFLKNFIHINVSFYKKYTSWSIWPVSIWGIEHIVINQIEIGQPQNCFLFWNYVATKNSLTCFL